MRREIKHTGYIFLEHLTLLLALLLPFLIILAGAFYALINYALSN